MVAEKTRQLANIASQPAVPGKRSGISFYQVFSYGKMYAKAVNRKSKTMNEMVSNGRKRRQQKKKEDYLRKERLCMKRKTRNEEEGNS